MVLLMLVPLLAPSDSGAAGLSTIAKALGVAGVKAVVAIVSIIAGGRVLLRPLYRRIAAMENAEIFAATTLLVVLGTSVLTQVAGLSLALGAFLVSSCESGPQSDKVQGAVVMLYRERSHCNSRIDWHLCHKCYANDVFCAATLVMSISSTAMQFDST